MSDPDAQAFWEQMWAEVQDDPRFQYVMNEGMRAMWLNQGPVVPYVPPRYGFTESLVLHPKDAQALMEAGVLPKPEPQWWLRQPPVMPTREQITAAVQECESRACADAYRQMLIDGVLRTAPVSHYDVWDSLAEEAVIDLKGNLAPATPRLPSAAEVDAMFRQYTPMPDPPLVISPHAYRKANRLLGRPEDAMGLTRADLYRAAEIEYKQSKGES